MTEKEKEAIEYFKGLNNLYNSGVQLLKYTDSECEYSNILLNLIEKQQKEIETLSTQNAMMSKRHFEDSGKLKKQDKMIDLMAKYIDDYSIEDEFCTKKNCYADDYINGHCEKCLNCIKEHFRKKVENNER